MSGSWVPVPEDSDFPLENLAYGVFQSAGSAHIGIAIGNSIFDLYAASKAGLLRDAISGDAAEAARLNPLLALGRESWRALRKRLTELLEAGSELPAEDREKLIVDRAAAEMLLPFEVRDYVDFYSSLEHATNLGKIMRPGSEPLLPNWRSLPIGYHGRAGTVVVSGTPIVRPYGQLKKEDGSIEFAPSRMLDVELEIGFVTGSGNALGKPIPVESARDHIFGLVLVNDWSARDIQAWEYQPLGPFLGKSFATTISPWVVPLDALEPYKAALPKQEPPPLEYLRARDDYNYDVTLEMALRTAAMRREGLAAGVISQTNSRLLYWSMAQQLAHATSNGATISPGDLFASGTISGKEPGSFGSLIELTWRGTKKLRLPSGEERAFLEDGDEVVMSGRCAARGKPNIGFGEADGTILPAPVR